MSPVRRARPLLGTIVEVCIEDAPPGVDARRAIDAAFAAVARVQALMSYHDPASEVSRINREAAAAAVEVSADTWRVLQAALVFSRASEGLFDVTVAPTLAALGFLPRHADQPRADARASWRDIELRPDRRVRLQRRLRIDLGGIAKGYAVDCAIDALRGHGVQTASVNAGGDLRFLGALPRTLHLRHPAQPTTLLPLALHKPAAATSAGYFRQRQRAGRDITPLIDPRSRRPCTGRLSVTVSAADCMSADALTKVVHADAAAAPALLRRFNAEAHVLDPHIVPRRPPSREEIAHA